jgi:PAS domain S-box-containing protein
MSEIKKAYTPPEITKFSAPSELPKHLRSALAEMLNSELTVFLDEHRVYQLVSPQFAKLLGYDSDELTGKKLDDITVKGTVDIDFIFDAFLKLGEMDGLWMFRDRNGKGVLFHYHARRLQDHLVCAKLEPLALAG